MNLSAEALPLMWAQYVTQQNIDGAVKLYNECFVLTPTFSPHVIKTQQTLIDYFMQLAQKKDLSVKVYEETVITQAISKEIFIISGTYAFSFTIDNTPQAFPARFTFVVDLAKQKPILHHHSSQLPGNLF